MTITTRFYFFAWFHLDLSTVEALGVEWRETNFLRTLNQRTRTRRLAQLRRRRRRKRRRIRRRKDASSNLTASSTSPLLSNHRHRLSGELFSHKQGAEDGAQGFDDREKGDVVRVGVLHGGVAISRSSSSSSSSLSAWHFIPSPSLNRNHIGGGGGSSRSVGVGSGQEETEGVLGSGFWPLLVDDLSNVPLLLVRFPSLDGAAPLSFTQTHGAPAWVEEVQRSLRWCNSERKGGMFQPKSATLAMSSDDCYGLGKTMALNKA
jgi:hypothetical protein